MVMLSLVMAFWCGMGMASSLRECTQAMRSTAGMRRWIPEPRVLRYLPNRSTTKAFFSDTMLTPQFNGVMGGSDLGRERINFSYQKVPEASGEAGRGGGRGRGLPGVVITRVREGEEPPLGHHGSPEEACHPRRREMGGGVGSGSSTVELSTVDGAVGLSTVQLI
jgi:hypothetical protein